jgi:hypothetical protein
VGSGPHGRATISINDPGEWRVVVLPDEGGGPQLFELQLSKLREVGDAGDYREVAHDAHTQMEIPPSTVEQGKNEHAVYAAFRVASVGDQEKGILIALTPLTQTAF